MSEVLIAFMGLIAWFHISSDTIVQGSTGNIEAFDVPSRTFPVLKWPGPSCVFVIGKFHVKHFPSR